ncbi:hypothetical protein PSACC_01295 [Paramicrosporidium saccamoebae]|uniref:Uncharacterized protein n=1 Tax=Paramicrosporidium saccamoebae TaxID=1246581 RepID=A0A2H9TMD3_9FUNG|nr:hypothetical protein PSACC_01295 [Paramicrosporidium saccamoebae]
MTPTLRDPNSVSNILAFVTKHIKLNWKVNFETSTIAATVVLTLARLTEEQTVRLDCSHLVVKRVTDLDSGQELSFRVDPNATKFGGLLAFDLCTKCPTYDIEYSSCAQLTL